MSRNFISLFGSGGDVLPEAAGANLLTNLISFWELEEATGLRIDAHGANDLTDNNTVTQQTGKVGNCAQFTQANDEFLDIASNATLNVGTGSFSWAGWVFHDTVSGGDNFQTYCAKDDIVTPIRGYLIGFNQTDHAPNNRFTFSCGNNGAAGNDVLDFSIGATVTTWHFVVAWRDVSGSPTINLQVDNGTPESLAHTVANIDGATEFNLGAVGTTLLRMNGRIDQALFAKRVWTPSERTWLYNSGNGRAYSELG